MTETIAAQATLADTTEQFKLAFGHQPAGVAIITATDENGEPAGFTASSLTSVAAEPPIIAFSLKANSGSAAKIAAASSFLVHMLDAENVTLAKNFATHDYPRFADPAAWEFVHTGEPLVHGVRRVLRATPSAALRRAPRSSSPPRLRSLSATIARAPRSSTTRATSTRSAITPTSTTTSSSPAAQAIHGAVFGGDHATNTAPRRTLNVATPGTNAQQKGSS